MRFAHTTEQVRAAEAAHPDLVSGGLMQRAAYGLATAVIDLLGGIYGRRVVLLVGSGDNGGDALYAGAVLARRGASVEAWLLGRDGTPASSSGQERTVETPPVHAGGLAALRAAGGRVASPRALRAGAVDVVIDGIVGIGGRPGLPAHVAEAVIPINPSIPIVAVDLPSGVDADTGELAGMAIRADLTVTFGTHKIAHLVDPAAANCGVVELVDLGLDLPAAPVEALQAEDVARLLRSPAASAQKYTRGVVGIRAGSETYPGAALLAVAGANTGLAGMVRYVGSAAEQVKVAHPEVVGDGRVQAWVVGPGGGDEAAAHLEAALADGVPLVVDADALTLLGTAGRSSVATRSRGSAAGADEGDGRGATDTEPDGPSRARALVLTPHAGELAQMLGAERREIEARPLHFARQAATTYDAVVLLKGRHTVIAQPAGPTRVNATGTPWLATAGAGDVLAGLIGSLLASGLSPFDAASVGAWLHGAAATQASSGGPLTATRVAEAIPAVVGELLT